MMKLKVLPPTLRKNNRYLTLDIKCENYLKKDDLVNIIWSSCLRFQGELNTADFNLWVMKFFDNGDNSYSAVVRCQRDYVDDVRSSLALCYKFNSKRISITTTAISGTIKGALKHI